MKIYSEKSLADFEPWSGAVRTYERISNAGMLDALESYLEDEYPDGIDETELNDLFWFEPEYVLSCCGLRTEEEIRDAIQEANEYLRGLNEDYLADAEELDKYSGLYGEELQKSWEKLYDENYREAIEEVEREIRDLERELDGM